MTDFQIKPGGPCVVRGGGKPATRRRCAKTFENTAKLNPSKNRRNNAKHQ